LARAGLALAGAALVTFHGWLFATQVAAGRFDDPWLVFRWVVGAGLVAALAAIRSSGGSLWSRQGTAVWVLAALLHGPAVATHFNPAVDSVAVPEVVAASLLALISAPALAITLWMLAGFLASRDRRPQFAACLAAAPSVADLFADGYPPPYSSRPPPRAR
jgi:hypothetical protein